MQGADREACTDDMTHASWTCTHDETTGTSAAMLLHEALPLSLWLMHHAKQQSMQSCDLKS